MTIETTAPPRITITQGLILLVGAIPLTIGFFAAQAWLGIAAAPLGFFFILYWGGVEQGKREKLAPVAIGSFFGLGLAFLLHTLTTSLDPALGGAIFLGVILLVVFVLIMNWLPLIVNTPAMLILTVAAYPPVMQSANFTEMAANLLLGVVYFGGVLTAFGALAQHLAKPKRPAGAAA